MAQTTNQPGDVCVRVPASIPPDAALRALADAERRTLLVNLRRLETPERLTALTRWLAVETDRSEDETVADLHARLHHVHVPTLVDAELVTYTSDEEMIELTDAGDAVAASLEE